MLRASAVASTGSVDHFLRAARPRRNELCRSDADRSRSVVLSSDDFSREVVRCREVVRVSGSERSELTSKRILALAN